MVDGFILRIVGLAGLNDGAGRAEQFVCQGVQDDFAVFSGGLLFVEVILQRTVFAEAGD